MKTKREFFTTLLNKLEKYKLNVEDIKKVEFDGEDEFIIAEKWVLANESLILRRDPTSQSLELGKKAKKLFDELQKK